ncbi:MAG: glycoside hydrolase family 65 protein [Acidiferrobacterales bacterium]
MNGWSLVYDNFEPEHEPLREALCTLGNGYFATRGAAEESQADEIHYPGTYLAGGYNRLDSYIAGRTITNEDLVNFPNWLLLKFRPEDGDWFNLMAVEILNYRQELDMKNGMLKRSVRFRDHHGRESTVASCRIVHMANPHLAAIEFRITPENWSGRVTVKSTLDGSVINAGVARYRELNSKHLETLAVGEHRKDVVYLLAQTNQSRIQMAQAARTRVYRDGDDLNAKRKTFRDESIIGQRLVFTLEQGGTATVEKIVALYSSRDRAVSEASHEARLALDRVGRFRELLAPHVRAWKSLWRRSDVTIRSSKSEQMVIRLHIFHVLQSVSPNTVGRDVGVPARGLHGEAYRGHIFWDELFIFPFYTFRMPAVTHTLLHYRYRRLDVARCLAAEEGYQGAMYPWQSGSNGREETQIVHLNPRSGIWGPDYSRFQRHVNAAIVYNTWQYFMLTGDKEFMEHYGAEMIMEIARFWASITTYNKRTRRYEIERVMGPDEYHEKYPGTDAPGLRNNAYSNVMAVWVLERALEVLELLRSERGRELKEKLGLRSEETKRWTDITRKMTIPFHGDGIISQFEGYDELEEFDWEGYRKKYGNIERLDRILKAEGDSPDRYKVSKQADVLMLFYLLSPKELRRIFNQLGYEFDDDMVQRNVEYYRDRTSHGSTLSKVVHASVLDRLDRTRAWRLFCEALESDISDIQGGTTPEGIHLGAMAGTVDIVLRHYGGIDTTSEIISFYPRLPESVRGLHLRLRHRNHWYELDMNDERFRLSLDADGLEPVEVNVRGEVHQLEPGGTLEFPYFHKVSGSMG